ncbi:hypothetical protein M3Y98_01207500 [Aphelenchoides besseyi]|nr:hypothetical protein M3Y98_01207500 [Aphelenchoides besseyi]KAI6193244.1 hypothetical protein M3Y96_00997900 [Aphelenchoides besseyi]
MSCFRLNETTGRNILEYADDVEFNAQIRIIHRYWSMFFSLISMTLNALLCVVIFRSSNSTIKISPMLLANSIIDFLLAAVYFINGRYIFVAYNRLFTLVNGFIGITNPICFRLLNVSVNVLTIASWHVIFAQFLYRMLLVKYNEPPRNRRLYLFLAFCFGLYALHLLIVLRGFFYVLPNEDIEDSVLILQHYGYDVQSYNLYGTVWKTNQPFTWSRNLSSMISLFGFILIIYSAIQIRRLLRRSAGMNVPATRRLNQAMDFTLYFMGIIPIVSNVFPSITLSILINQCQSNAAFSLLLYTCLLSASFLNACVTDSN